MKHVLKNTISLILAAIFLVLLLAACGGHRPPVQARPRARRLKKLHPHQHRYRKLRWDILGGAIRYALNVQRL